MPGLSIGVVARERLSYEYAWVIYWCKWLGKGCRKQTISQGNSMC